MRAHVHDSDRRTGRWFGRGRKGSGVVHRSLTFGRCAPSRNAAPCETFAVHPERRARRATNPNGGATRPAARFNDADQPQPAAQIAILAARGVTRSPNLARGSRQGRCPRLRCRSDRDHGANRVLAQAYCAVRKDQSTKRRRPRGPPIDRDLRTDRGSAPTIGVHPMHVWTICPWNVLTPVPWHGGRFHFGWAGSLIGSVS